MRAHHINPVLSTLGVAVAALAALPGCESGESQLPMTQASALVNGTIRLGMSSSRRRLPAWTSHQIETSGVIEFLFYRTPPLMKAGTMGSNPIAIADGKVVGTGLIYYYKNRAPHSE